jgi:hypothetical protein
MNQLPASAYHYTFYQVHFRASYIFCFVLLIRYGLIATGSQIVPSSPTTDKLPNHVVCYAELMPIYPDICKSYIYQSGHDQASLPQATPLSNGRFMMTLMFAQGFHLVSRESSDQPSSLPRAIAQSWWRILLSIRDQCVTRMNDCTSSFLLCFTSVGNSFGCFLSFSVIRRHVGQL